LGCDVGDKAITVHLEASGDCRMEIERARQKQDLLEGKTGRRIEYRC
jgi:hypothetical protein